MVEFGEIEDVVGAIAVGVNHGIWDDFLTDDGEQGVSADVRDHHGVDFAAALEDAKDGRLAGGATTTFAFANPAEVALVGLDETVDRQTGVELVGDDLAQPLEEVGGGFSVNPDQIRSGSRRDAANKKLSQPILRLSRQTTTAYPHKLILDPDRIWDSPKIFSFGIAVTH